MKKSNIYFEKRNSIPVFLLLMLFSITVIHFTSCKKEDDIPPPSAFVPPVPDTTGACVFLNVMPELSGDEALDFECEGPAPADYTVFGELNGAITIEYADNPATGGINSSENAVKVTQTAGVEPWAGFFFDLSSKIDFSVYQAIRIKVYSPAAGHVVNLKLEDSADGAINKEISTPTTVANEWEELCFSFAAGDTDKFDRFVLFFDFFGPKDTETIHYYDDIILGDDCPPVTGPTEPTTAAPTPTAAEADVISLFSDTYTNVTGTDFNPDWGQATVVTEVDIAGNNTLKYENLNYQGIALESAIDVSEMAFLHVDYWTANSTAFNGFLISSGPVETAHAFAITTEEWVSVDIPLSEFSSVVDLMDVIQMKFDGNGTIYLDNIYFHKLPSGPSTAAPTPTVPEADVISIFSDAYTNVAGTDFNPDWGQATVVTEIDIAGNNTLKYENLNYQGTMFASALDVSGMSFLHVDYWTANSTGFNGFLISSGPAETPHAFAVTIGQWVSVDIPLTEFSSVVDLMDVIQMKFDGDGTIYLDNIYFHKLPSGPSTAAPTPTVPEADVISIFSDAYTNVAGTDFNPDWGQATVVTEVDIAGNNTLKYENLNYQGTMFASALDVSGMSFLHVDYWTANSTGFNGFLISTGPAETPHAFAVTTGEWVSVDIPLTEFSSVVDLMDVIQMKFDGDGTIYLDNIYFYIELPTEPTTAAPTPTVPEADVISIFSDAYTNVAGTDFNPDWGQATVVTEVDIAGNNTLKYENLNYQGTMFASALDVSGESFLHIDYWTANSTGFNGFLISTGPAETPHAFTVTTGQWVSVDIPLSTFSSVVDLMDVIQMKFDGDGTIYLDNIYFH